MLNSQLVSFVNYQTVQKSLKKDFRQKRYRKVFNYLQHHKPESDEHMLPYYEAYLKSVVKLVHTFNLRKDNQLDTLLKYGELALRLIQLIQEEMCYEESVLEGKVRVRENVSRQIDRFWATLIDLGLNLYLTFKGLAKTQECFVCLIAADKIASQVQDSSTLNPTLLSKVCQTKFQLGVLHFQFGNNLLSISYLEKGLLIARDELTLRCRYKHHSKSASPKHQVQYFACQKTILMIFITLALAYEAVKIYDMVVYLIGEAKQLALEFGVERSDGIFKTLEKLESQEFLRRFEKYAAGLEELSIITSCIFDFAEIEAIVREKEPRAFRLNSAAAQPQTSSPGSCSNLKALYVGTTTSSSQASAPRISINTTEQQRCHLTSIHPIDKLQFHEKSADGSSAGLINLTQELLFYKDSEVVVKKRVSLSRKRVKQDKKKRVMPPPTRKQLLLTGQETQREAYLKIYLQTKNQIDRFQPIEEVSEGLRKLSVELKRTKNDIEYEKCKIRSRSRCRLSNMRTPRSLSLPTSQCLRPTSTPKYGDSSPDPTPAPKNQISTNSEFQQLILRHKDQLSLNRLQNHFMRVRDKENKQQTKIRRMGRKVSFVKNKEIIAKLHSQTQQGIAKLIRELKVEPTARDSDRDMVERVVGDPKLFLTYNGHLQASRP